ncbi:MAG: Lytic transglycosylase [Candidatus Tokpelaia sp. JSC188]|nr:MAG: Lytic transglycosylase [Candidatus Tokpelaia sp. JSC188]
MKRILLSIALVSFLAKCASTPTHTTNACAVFKQKNGLLFNWHRSAKKAEQVYGIPMPIILATIYTESGFQQRARPPRRKLLGFIPWKRSSSAYGYPQAINSAWEEYRKQTGYTSARRTSFDHAAKFIAWYHHKSVARNNVSPNDAYALYLNYHMGHNAYAKNHGQGSMIAIQGAHRVQTMAEQYDMQLRNCGMR